MTPRMLRHLIHSGLVLIGIFLVGAFSTSAMRNSDDLDLDGYIAQEVGGNDCHDSLQAAYKTNGTNCSPTIQPTFVETVRAIPDRDIADHTWMRDDSGLYHLYLQNQDTGSGDFIQHYTTPSLGQPLTYVGPALQQTAGGWDRYGMWAPHVIKNPTDGLYYMFYAGTTASGSNADAQQRIGVATSSDLTTWTKIPINTCSGTSGDGCVYECAESWTVWGKGGAYYDQCRDPFVIWDAVNSRWLLFTTVSMDNTVIGGPWTQGISVAQSTDLLHWTGIGYIKGAKRQWSSEGGTGAQLTGGVAENPFVTEYNGDYYLFFTDSNDPEDYSYVANPRTEVQYLSSPTLDVDASGSVNWVYRGSTQDPGVNAAEIQVVNGDTWVVSHSIVPNPYSGYWFSHRRDLRLKRIVWNTNGTFTTANLIDPVCRVPSADINPAMPELCGDGLDNNCSGQVDDPMLCGVCTDQDTDGYGISGLLQCRFPQADCNDQNASVNPAATEVCGDGIDNNCNGETDEVSCVTICHDQDGDGYGISGFSACADPRPDCNDFDESVNPGAAEMCSDSTDNNCNGQVDEPLCQGTCVDTDSDGYGTNGLLSCPNQQPDCNDASNQTYPGAPERCDRVDNNCNSLVDEGNVCPRKTREPKWILCVDSGDPQFPGPCYVYN